MFYLTDGRTYLIAKGTYVVYLLAVLLTDIRWKVKFIFGSHTLKYRNAQTPLHNCFTVLFFLTVSVFGDLSLKCWSQHHKAKICFAAGSSSTVFSQRRQASLPTKSGENLGLSLQLTKRNKMCNKQLRLSVQYVWHWLLYLYYSIILSWLLLLWNAGELANGTRRSVNPL